MKNTTSKVLVLAIIMGMLSLLIGSALAQDTTAERGFLGIGYASDDAGVRVTEVVANSPAEAAGIQVDDIITAIDDTSVTGDTIVDVISGYSAGDTIQLTVLRGEETLELSATLSKTPTSTARLPGFRLNNLGLGFALSEDGLSITQLSEDHPLYEAGLREGDVITAINGEPLSIPGIMPQLRAAESVTLTVQRGDETLDIEINPKEVMGIPFFSVRPFGDMRPNQPNAPFGFQMGIPANRAQLGVRYVMLTEDNAADYDVSLTEGAYIAEVIAGSPAEKAGLMVGDVVTAVNGDVVDAQRTLAERIYPYEPGDVITLDVVRGDETLQIEVTLGSSMESAGVFPQGMFNFDFDGRGFRFGDGDNFPFFIPDNPNTPESSGSF